MAATDLPSPGGGAPPTSLGRRDATANGRGPHPVAALLLDRRVVRFGDREAAGAELFSEIREPENLVRVDDDPPAGTRVDETSRGGSSSRECRRGVRRRPVSSSRRSTAQPLRWCRLRTPADGQATRGQHLAQSIGFRPLDLGEGLRRTDADQRNRPTRLLSGQRSPAAPPENPGSTECEEGGDERIGAVLSPYLDAATGTKTLRHGTTRHLMTPRAGALHDTHRGISYTPRTPTRRCCRPPDRPSSSSSGTRNAPTAEPDDPLLPRLDRSRIRRPHPVRRLSITRRSRSPRTSTRMAQGSNARQPIG